VRGKCSKNKVSCLEHFFESIHDFAIRSAPGGVSSAAIFLLLLSHVDLGQTRSFTVRGAALQLSIVAF
jgi:hypothetical protein